MGQKVKPDGLAKAIMDELKKFEGVTVDAIKTASDKSSKQAVRTLRQTSPRRTGEYAKSWTSKNSATHNKWAAGKVVYNKEHYRLTHLLEKGHRITGAIKTGGFTKAREHIAPAEQQAVEDFERILKEEIEHGS